MMFSTLHPPSNHTGRLTKWKGRVVSVAPGMLASASAMALCASGAMAAEITTALTTPQELVTDEDLNVTTSGSVIATGAAQEEAIGIAAVPYSSTFTNRGTLRYSSSTGDASGARIKGDLSGDVLNYGTASGTSTSSDDAFGLFIEGNVTASGRIINFGALEATATNPAGAAAVGVRIGSDLLGSLSNQGTITTRATAVSGSADARGILSADVGAGASLSNAGTISVETEAGSAFVWGIQTGVISGDVLNTGLIEVKTVGATAGNQAKVGIRGTTLNATGSVTNSGRITLSQTVQSTYETGLGMLMNSVSGLLSNSGTIDISGSSTGFLYNYGMRASSILSSGEVANSGAITINVEGTSADAEGVNSANIDGRLVNTGQIDVVARATAFLAIVDGITGRDVAATGVVRNTGTINTLAQSTGTAGSAYGISVSEQNGFLSNTGTIMATGNGQAYVGAYGVDMRNIGATGMAENTGAITASATSSGGSAYAIGMAALNISGTLRNAGALEVSATASTASATAYGFSMTGSTGVLVNTGTISVSAASDGLVLSSGVDATNAVSDFTNTGSIEVSGAGGGAGVDVYGVRVGTNHTGTISNQGRIVATATGGTSGDGYGVAILGTSNGVIDNSGFISGRSEIGTGYAIYAPTGTGTINLRAAGDIEGTIRVDGHDVNMFANPGQSKTLRFEDSDTGTGTFTTDSSTGALWFSTGAGGATPVYATVDMSATTTDQQAAAEFASIGARHQRDMLTRALSRPVQIAPDAAGFSFMAQATPEAIASLLLPQREGFAFAEVTRTTASPTPGSESRMTTRSLQAGTIDVSQNGTAWLLTAGAIDARSTSLSGGVTSQTTDIKGAFVGAEFARNFGAYTVNYGARAGLQDNDSERYINLGSETARASYDSKWISASLGISRGFDLGPGAQIVPSARLSHTAYSADGYTEKGSAANATVEGRSGQTTDLTVGLDYLKTVTGGLFRAGFELTSRQSSGQDPVGVTVFGTQQDFDSDPFEANFGTVSFGYVQELRPGMTLDLGAQIAFGSNNYRSQSLTAQISMTF